MTNELRDGGHIQRRKKSFIFWKKKKANEVLKRDMEEKQDGSKVCLKVITVN